MKKISSSSIYKSSQSQKIGPLGEKSRFVKLVSLILDTDIGNDIDDALALVLIHALESLDECRLLGVAINKDNRYAPIFVDIINTFYGRSDIPIGMVRDGKTPQDGFFLRQIAEARNHKGYLYPRTTKDHSRCCAVDLYRRLLASQPDHSVTIASIGFFTNLARLLVSGPDNYSPLTGKELVAQKVCLLSAMAGNFSKEALSTFTVENAEYNVANDIDSARYVCENWPTSIVFSGLELGRQITFPAEVIERGFNWAINHPVVHAYKLFKTMPYDRPLWDLTSVLFAVRTKYDYFDISIRGRVGVEAGGGVTFKEDVAGNHQYLSVASAQCRRIQTELIRLCSFMPKNIERLETGF